jgi:4'-phosphopantetheinyl transferase
VSAASVFVAERGDPDSFVREVLGSALGCEPAELRFGRTERGKPFLEHPAGGPRFSVSHSGGLVAVAVAAGREVGVDVQETRPVTRLMEIAERHFTPDESAALRGAGGDERLALFHRLWVRKEAYLKATGEGLAGSLASFDALALSLPPGWELEDLELPAGYAGAVAVCPLSHS